MFRSVGNIFTLLLDIRNTLLRIERQLKLPPPAVGFEFYVGEEGHQRKVEFVMNLKVSQKLPMSINPVDKFGNAAKVDGAPVWSLTDPSLGSLAVADDGMSAELTPAGAAGSCEVQVNADADLGEGVKTIVGSLPVELVAGDAVSVSIAAGSPVDV